MSGVVSSVGSAVSRAFTIGGGSAPAAPATPAAPAMPQILVTPPVPQAPAPIPDPYSASVMAARTAAAQKALGAQGRASTILTTAKSRGTSTIGGGGSTAGSTYAASTLGGSQ
jgi:hypothetical protein